MRKQLEDVGVSFKSVSAKIDKISAQLETRTKQPDTMPSLLPKDSVIGGPARTLRSALRIDDSHAQIEKTILKTFEYDQMHVRRETISEAHAKTFRWILDSSAQDTECVWDDFMQWLTGPDSIYWIKGKAASGKSTLMKFLLQQKEVDIALQQWSDPLPLARADFFFSSLGTPLQQSQTGLLMSLLRQLLEQHRQLMPTVVPELWKNVSALSSHASDPLETREIAARFSWTFGDLKSTFESVLRRLARDRKIVIFVDGLDEFDGDYEEVAEVFNRFLTLHDTHIKICVSSRPLMAFEYSFKGCPNLRLQDLTAQDIHTYVTDKLNAHTHFKLLATDSLNQTEDFVDMITNKSSGVFLWVHLVVKSLLAGLTNYDAMEDLIERLKILPPELDTLYGAMLRSIKPTFYRGQASQLLQIVYQYGQTISSLALSFADEQDTELAINAPIAPLELPQVDARIEAISMRVQSRCQGLLEVQKYKSTDVVPANPDSPFRWDEVRYLHLTVREYLEKPDIWADLLEWTADSGFDAHIACASSLLLRIKTTASYYGWGVYLRRLLDNAINFVAKAELSTSKAHVALVDEIDRVATRLLPVDRCLPWIADDRGVHAQFCQVTCSCLTITLLEYAVLQGLTLYARHKLGASFYSAPYESPYHLLDVAIGAQLSLEDKTKIDHTVVTGRQRKPGVHEFISTTYILTRGMPSGQEQSRHSAQPDTRPLPSMIQMLLDFGFDPNEKNRSGTPWLNLLEHLEGLKTQASPLKSVWVDICKLYILYGADLQDHGRNKNASGGTTSVAQRIKELFYDTPGQSTDELFQMINQRALKDPRKRSREEEQTSLHSKERRNGEPSSSQALKTRKRRKRRHGNRGGKRG